MYYVKNPFMGYLDNKQQEDLEYLMENEPFFLNIENTSEGDGYMESIVDNDGNYYYQPYAKVPTLANVSNRLVVV